MQLSIALVFALKILSVENRAQLSQVLDPSDADSLGINAPPTSSCICTPYFNCYDTETSSNINGLVDDRSGIENHPTITIRQDGEPTECPDFLEVCCHNLVPPPVTVPTTDSSPQPQPPIPSEISTQTPTTNPSPHPQPPIPDVPLPAASGEPIASNGECGVRNSNGVNFTIDGFTESQAQYGEFPWMVALLAPGTHLGAENLYVGGGSLIDPLVVLTAAHKAYDANTTLTVRIGEWNFKTFSEPTKHQDINVSEIIYHPRFNRDTMAYNFALLILEWPVELGNTVGTICLPSSPGQRFDGQQCILSGWGKDVFGEQGKYQRILKLVNVNMVEYTQCQSAMQTTDLGSKFRLHRSFVCAGDQGQDACTGDGGSPLVCLDPTSPGQYVQVGVSSWGMGCGQPGIPGVYSAVAPAIEWIQNTVDTIVAQNVDLRIVAVGAVLRSRCPGISADCKTCYTFNIRTCQCHKMFRCRPESVLKKIND